MRKTVIGLTISAFVALSLLVVAVEVSSVCIVPMKYQVVFINMEEFPDYIFITHIKDASGYYNYHIVNETDQLVFSSLNKSIIIGNGVYYTKKSNFKSVNITETEIPITSTFDVIEDGEVVGTRTMITGARYEYNYNFENDENYTLWELEHYWKGLPCGPEQQNYPAYREDFYSIISLGEDNITFDLERTVWHFSNGTDVIIDNPAKDIETPIMDIYEGSATTDNQSFTSSLIYSLMYLIFLALLTIIVWGPILTYLVAYKISGKKSAKKAAVVSIPIFIIIEFFLFIFMFMPR